MSISSPDMFDTAGGAVILKESPVAPSFLNDSRRLKILEDAEALEQLPVLLLLGIMSVLGDLGNALALYVYYTRFTPSSTRTYIIAMSVGDMLFCSITLPGEILDLRFPLTYNAKWLCRLHRLISVSLTLFSALILVTVALDRRRKICFPFRPQLTPRQVSLSVIGCLVAAVAIGFPFGVMNGRHTVKTEVEGLVGSACSVDDAFIDTSFPLVYNGILLLIFLSCAVTMSFSYVQIARKVVKHKRKSMAVGGGTVKGLAALMGKGEPGTDMDIPQSSSHFDNTSDLDPKRHEPDYSVSETPLRTGENSKVDDEVFAADTERTTPLPESAAKECAAEKSPHRETNSSPHVKKLRNVFKSRSLKKREKAFEMAVSTLGHAVSEEMLNSSELFQKRASRSFSRSRSASVGDASPSLRWKGFPESAAPKPELSATAPPGEADAVKPGVDVKASLTSPGNDAEKTGRNAKEEDDRNTPKRTGGIQFKKVERSTSLKSNGESRGRGMKRNASLNSSVKSKNGTKDDADSVRHVNISESHSDRLQSVLYNTLRRIKPRTHGSEGDVTSTSSRRRRHWGKRIPSRTTWMMFVLTAIFVISYLPYLVLVCVRAVDHEIETQLQGWKLNLYTLGLKSYFINSIVNPFVYSFCSARFRHQCHYLFRRRPKMSISD